LCGRALDLFTELSHVTSASNKLEPSRAQELVEGLAHELRNLVRIALTRALKLKDELGDSSDALERFLGRVEALLKSSEDVPASSLATAGRDKSSPAAYEYRSFESGDGPESASMLHTYSFTLNIALRRSRAFWKSQWTTNERGEFGI
jgi:hypothetical protein